MNKRIGMTVFAGVLGAVFCLSARGVLAADDETNKKILKDAIQGAITGAVATQATKDEPKSTEVKKDTAPGTGNAVEHKHKHKHKDKEKHKKHHKHDEDEDHDHDHDHDHGKKGHRPPGWDKGKKVGWGGKDLPPGLAKKQENAKD